VPKIMRIGSLDRHYPTELGLYFYLPCVVSELQSVNLLSNEYHNDDDNVAM